MGEDAITSHILSFRLSCVCRAQLRQCLRQHRLHARQQLARPTTCEVRESVALVQSVVDPGTEAVAGCIFGTAVHRPEDIPDARGGAARQQVDGPRGERVAPPKAVVIQYGRDRGGIGAAVDQQVEGPQIAVEQLRTRDLVEQVRVRRAGSAARAPPAARDRRC